MGNRATILFVDDSKEPKHISPAVYLHWNGGPESVYPFLDELDRRRVRAGDVDHEAARFAHVVCDFFDKDAATSLSVGVFNGPAAISAEALEDYDPGDNGIYVVCRDEPRRVRRFRFRGTLSLIEASPDDVDRERQAAYRHEYTTGDLGGGKSMTPLPATLQALRPEVSKVG